MGSGGLGNVKLRAGPDNLKCLFQNDSMIQNPQGETQCLISYINS